VGETPGDLARWAFYVGLRARLRGRSEASVQAVASLGRLAPLRRGEARRLLADEFARCGLRGDTDFTWELQWRASVVELTLGSTSAETARARVRFDGWEHLEAARAAGRGVVWVYPHAGPVMLMLAALSARGVPYVQVAARGLAPADVAAAHPELLRHTPLREAVRHAREADEDRTGVRFATAAEPLRALHRALGRNEVVGIAFDGRTGRRWVPVPFLGRTALLNPGAVRLAAQTGAMLVPAVVSTRRDAPGATCTIGAPVPGDAPDALARILAHVEPGIRARPEDYGAWLLHCRRRAAIDDHPLFVDHAPDDRWRRWVG
jgi:KDO2-lipid IV(A) lauroyltransferase